jgi:hypothetical protein
MFRKYIVSNDVAFSRRPHTVLQLAMVHSSCPVHNATYHMLSGLVDVEISPSRVAHSSESE